MNSRDIFAAKQNKDIMAKDPAFLFYSSDFLTGTAFFSNEQIGIYIRLLCLQHQHGGIRELDMINMCGAHLSHIITKFVKDEAGLYVNKRLVSEMAKRKNYAESRRQNRLSAVSKEKKSDLNSSKEKKSKENTPLSQSPALTYVPHMENEIENENRNEDRIENKGVQGEKKSQRASLSRTSKSPPAIAQPIILPFTSPEFLNAWDQWKCYKQQQHRFEFKSPITEQAALSELAKLAGGIESSAIAIILQSIANGWAGLFTLKTNNNHEQRNANNTNTAKQPTGGNVNTSSAFAAIDRIFGPDGKRGTGI